jgi:limonene-1,2-epoxide hydrolase
MRISKKIIALGVVVLLYSSTSQNVNGQNHPEMKSSPMQNNSNTSLEVVRAFNAAMEKMDFETALKYVADSCEYTNGSLGTVYGHAGFRKVLEPFFSLMLENEFIILRESANESIVFMERLDRHRLPTGWIELPVTGVYEVHNGQITVWHDYFDSAKIAKQMPAPRK